MADNTVVHIGENSPEQIAWKLLERIAAVENVTMYSHTPHDGNKVADRNWILSTYIECQKATRGFGPK
jgi:hypothetical protein